jgi:outer membrane protein assembly factor BamD (BamD/ComL family)
VVPTKPDVPPTKVTGPAVIGPSEVSAVKVSGDPNASASEQQTAVLIAEARAALQKNNYQAAIAQLKKAVQLADNRRSPEARELLGVAYQKDRQIAAAKSVYEDYLRRYPNREGSEGVRQRLLAIETAGAPTAATL